MKHLFAARVLNLKDFLFHRNRFYGDIILYITDMNMNKNNVARYYKIT